MDISKHPAADYSALCEKLVVKWGVPYPVLRNPEGVEAAAAIRDLEAKLAKARGALGAIGSGVTPNIPDADFQRRARYDLEEIARRTLASLDAEPDYRAINLYRDSLDEPANNPCRLSTDAAGVAGEILSMLGLSQSDSFEPGEDYRRDMIADLIDAALDKAREEGALFTKEKTNG